MPFFKQREAIFRVQSLISDMYKTVINQILVQDLPLKIQCLDYYSSLLIVLTRDGSLLKFKIIEDPFEIDLKFVLKNYCDGFTKCLILEKSKSIFYLKSGRIYTDTLDFGIDDSNEQPGNSTLDAAGKRMLSQLPQITDARCLARFGTKKSDLVVIGCKRGLWIVNVDVNSVNISNMILLPTTPRHLEFMNENHVLVSGKSVLIVNITTRTFVVKFDVKESFLMKKSIHQAMILEKYLEFDVDKGDIGGEQEIYCSKGTGFYKLSVGEGSDYKLIFNWESTPIKCSVQEYFVLGLFPTKIEIKSLKTGTTLEIIDSTAVDLISLDGLVITWSQNVVSRIFPLDFHDQIDELLNSNKFLAAEALINELEFKYEHEKLGNIVKVKGAYAQYLFCIENKYEQSLSVLESVNASPLDVLELYPDILDNQEQFTNSDVASNPDSLIPLAQYLSKQRAKLITFKFELENKRNGLDGTKDEGEFFEALNLLSLVERCLLKTLLATNSSLLKPFLRLEISTDAQTVVKLLRGWERNEELIEYYRARKMHKDALEFILRYLKLIVVSERAKMICKCFLTT